MTLGDSFTTVLAAQHAVTDDQDVITQAQTRLKTAQETLDATNAAFGKALKATQVAAVLAPTSNPDGSTSIALRDDNNPLGFRIILAAPPTIVVPEPAP